MKACALRRHATVAAALGAGLFACAPSSSPAAKGAAAPIGSPAAAGASAATAPSGRIALDTADAGRPLTPAQIAALALPAIVTIRTGDALGTGFIVRPDGWIATNLHVVIGGGPRAKITLRSERELEVVEVLAASPEHDLALLRVEAQGLPVVALGDSDAMQPGDPVVAIGNPLGLEDTVSNGLVSARRKADDGTEVLQISAPIAPGSSGGPIFNDRGQVIGIALAVLEQGQNLNFGVPARYLAPMLREPVPIPFADFARLVGRVRRAHGPAIERHVPRHPASILDGCSEGAQRLLVSMIGDAIDAGAPLFNDGKAASCYHVYDGAASDLQRKLPATCRGPSRALAEAQRRALALPSPVAQAWALRDAFDGLVEVVLRRRNAK